MPYKDPEKRKQAQRESQQRRRGVDTGVDMDTGVDTIGTPEGITDQGITLPSNLTDREARWILSHRDTEIHNSDRLLKVYESLHAKKLDVHCWMGELSFDEIGPALQKL